MHDGLELETRGVPTAVICTEPFLPTAQAIRLSRGVPDYPFVVVEHPIGSLTDQELAAVAARATTEVFRILKDGPAAIGRPGPSVEAPN